MDRRNTLALLLAAGALYPARAFAQAASPRPQAPLNAVERAFYRHASASLQRLFPTAAAGVRGGYIRYTNEDDTGAISYLNVRYLALSDIGHPQQLWYDVHGRLLGADYTQLVASAPKPTLFGLQRSRYHHITQHIHFGLRQADGSIRYGLYILFDDYTAGDPHHPTAAGLVELGKAKSISQVAFVFAVPENWDAQLWVIPNPAGQFADANPLVKPSPNQGGGSGEVKM